MITPIMLLWEVTSYLQGEAHIEDVKKLAYQLKRSNPELSSKIDDMLDNIEKSRKEIMERARDIINHKP